MLDPKFKSMQFVNIYVWHENATNMVAKYDQKLLHLLLEAYKLLMFIEVQEFQNFGVIVDSQICSKPLTQLYTIFKKSLRKSSINFAFIPCMQKTTNVFLTWWCIEKTQVFHLHLGYTNATHFEDLG